MASRLAIKDATITSYHNYGSALLNMLIRKPRDAHKSRQKTSSARHTHHKDTTPSNLSSICDPETGQLTSNSTSVDAIIKRLETRLLSPYRKINPLAPFPWLNEISPGQPLEQNMIIGEITPTIF